MPPTTSCTAQRSICLIILSLLASSAFSQALPDAGTLQRDSERSLQAPQPAEPPAVRPSPPPMDENAKGARITVRHIIIEGATLIPAAKLEALVADRIGQSLTLAELEHTAQRIAEYYRGQGWFVRVYLPQQDVTDGTIRIQVVEGRYGGATLRNRDSRANGDFVQAIVTRRLQTGQPLSAADLERGLLIANDLPGIRATGQLAAGQARGETRLHLDIEDTPLVTGDIGGNNFGNKYTGTAQLAGGIAFNNLTGRGDQLAIRALAAKHLYSARLQYSLPLGTDGWRLSLHGSTLGYRLSGRYDPLDAEGQAYTGGLAVSYPLIRQSDRNLTVSMGYEHRRYDDDILDTALRRHRIDAVSLRLAGDRRDRLAGGGVTWGELRLIQGRLGLSDVAADKAIDAAGPRTRGDYAKLAFQLNRLQILGRGSPWQLMAAFSGQLADGNLSSSERMALGGPYGVRAYPINEAMGDEGLLLKLELRRDLGAGWQALVFYDAGHIRQHKKTWSGWDGGRGQPNTYSLSGAGLGVNWRGHGAVAGWLMTASVAFPLGGNPGASPKNENNDGSSASSAHYWLNLSKSF
ncbi:ShlB/FhaC/HecB family hemolysin secretion/activation protein [Castellaniella sp. S9]|uniref:ShlB/FhaC/HecB family hemolysin secretion/activation protein n=1 Tax=Castellaniella sp. S9 TaxID=2993652 RepID=UPI0022B31486|nr:ShlB/FhaC/HecB family hemolysin secretion/activation protein [Castellaniella sp. S9]